MQECVSIILVANAGVLVTYNGIKFLIDGLFHDRERGFSNIPEQELHNILAGKDEFKDIDYILFTHYHPDHFSAEYTMEYLKNNDISCILLPSDESGEISELQDYIKENYVDYRLLNMPIGESYFFKVKKDISVTVFKAFHMGKQYSAIENYCFLLSLGKKNILFTADADYIDSYFETPLSSVNVDTVFVNPLFFNNKAGRTVIEKVIQSNKVGLYHIPFTKDDKRKYRMIVEGDIKRYKNEFVNVFALWNEGQKIFI